MLYTQRNIKPENDQKFTIKNTFQNSIGATFTHNSSRFSQSFSNMPISLFIIPPNGAY